MISKINGPNQTTVDTRLRPGAGISEQTNGVHNLSGKLPAERQFLPMEMKAAGYQTAMIEKWHLKEEPSTFDYYCVLPGQGYRQTLDV